MTSQAKDPMDTGEPTGFNVLQRFRGRLVSRELITRTFGEGTNSRDAKRAKFNFTEIEVKEATEPYNFPIAEIELGYAPRRGQTRWEAWASSVRRLLPEGDPSLLDGKLQEWAYLPCTLRRPVEQDNPSGAWEEYEDKAYQVVWVEGYEGADGEGASNIMEAVADLVDGKNDAQFLQEFFTNAELRRMPQHAEVVTQATNEELLPALEAAGAISRDDDGVWHKNEGS